MIRELALKLNKNWKGKDFLSLKDLTKKQIEDLIKLAQLLKEKQTEEISHHYLNGKTLAMIFEKPSTRTRVSFETGMYQLGGHALFLGKEDIQMGSGESIADTAKVLSRYVDGIMIRTFGHHIVENLAKEASVPVINGLSDDFHPCQVLADLMTIYEKKGTFSDLKLAYIGDGNNMAHSLLIGCAIMGIDCSIGSPAGYEVSAEVLKKAKKLAESSGAIITQMNDPALAVNDADIIYTDVWASMGFEDEAESRLKAFQHFQVNKALCQNAKEDFIFMHCLPARREEEVTSSILDSEHSVVFDEAENRLHAQKAILLTLMF